MPIDNNSADLQAEIETAIFEYERKTGIILNRIEISRESEIDFSYRMIDSNSNELEMPHDS